MVNYSLLSFILRGKRRKMVLLSLKEQPKIPKQISEECHLSIHNVSKSLKELADKGFIKCKNPNDKFFRFYEITNKGRELILLLKN